MASELESRVSKKERLDFHSWLSARYFSGVGCQSASMSVRSRGVSRGHSLGRTS